MINSEVKTHSHRELIVWQRAMQLVEAVYELTNFFPKSEQYGLTSQIRRSSVSIPSNIAEGRKRGSRKEYRQFLLVAYGSGAELETQLEISRRLHFIKGFRDQAVNSLPLEVMKMLNKMITSLKVERPKNLKN